MYNTKARTLHVFSHASYLEIHIACLFYFIFFNFFFHSTFKGLPNRARSPDRGVYVATLTTLRLFIKAGPPWGYFSHLWSQSLNFLFETSWKIWKWTPLLCACAEAITLETQKCRKGRLSPSNITFLFIAIDRNGFRRMKDEGQI